MYMDGLVIRTHPHVKLIREMGPALEEFKRGLKNKTVYYNLETGQVYGHAGTPQTFLL